MGSKHEYFDKFWWWRRGYDAEREPTPNLVISARRLDTPADSIEIKNATSGYSADPDHDWHSMLVGMRFPGSGCWEITGVYNDTETLTFILKVGPD
ncbi:hypothetical protein [Microbulbifer magnicolonia]|uniref:hypothetical protein n=1 Tax=Microbulbifer magnicolonia TaxID=3109744 RepID=UPI002B406D55|nr:hypothetical protein [Microbulbifer sp. GG15]